MNKQQIKAIIICMLGGIFVLYQFLLQGSTSLMVPELVRDLCINMTQVGVLSSAFFYSYIILQLPSGLLIDKIGPRKTLIISTLLLTLTTFLFSFTTNIYEADLIRILMGAASAPGVACGMYLVARWAPDKFTIMAGMIEMLGMLGGALGDYAIEYLTHLYSWRITMLVATLVGIILLILIIFIIRDKPKNCTYVKENNDSSIIENFKLIIKNINVWKHCLYGGLIFAVISAFASLWSIPFLTSLYPHQPTFVSHSTALIFIGAAVGTVLSGWLAYYLKSSKLIMQIFALLVLIDFIIIIYIPISPVIMQFLLFFIGTFSGAYILPFGTVEKLIPKHAQGIAMAFTNMVIICLGGPILQPLIGWLLNLYAKKDLFCPANSVAAFQYAFIPLVVSFVLALLISVIIKNNKIKN